MSNVIQFLESLGSSSRSSYLSTTEFASVVEGLNMEPAQRQALLDRNIPALCESMKARPTMFCMIATPDGGETEDVPGGLEEEPGSEESEEE